MTNVSVNPQEALARTGLYRKIRDAEFIACGDGAVASGFTADDSEQVKKCALLDVTAVTHSGWRGKAAADHLQSLALPVPEKPDQALSAESGETVLRLSNSEFWLLGGINDLGKAASELLAQPVPDSNCYPLFCQDSHAWLMLSGTCCADVMAKLCGVDMRSAAFPPGSIAQTSVARINAIVVSHEVNGLPVFSLLFDSGYHAYMWDVMLDAIGEFAGAAAGVSALTV